jgi:hypothetical protein
MKFSTEDNTHDDLSYSQHTDMATAWVCSRKSSPPPTLSRPLGEDANKQPFQPPQNLHQR